MVVKVKVIKKDSFKNFCGICSKRLGNLCCRIWWEDKKSITGFEITTHLTCCYNLLKKLSPRLEYKKMKEKKVKFICDNCGNETDFHKEAKKDTLPYKKWHPYEYQEGWFYLHSIKMRLWKITIEFKDNHFCCKECFFKFLKKDIEQRIKSQVLNSLKK